MKCQKNIFKNTGIIENEGKIYLESLNEINMKSEITRILVLLTI